jgi:IS1 family transposase
VHTQQENLPGAQYYLDSHGDTWVWLAFAPVWRLVLGFVVGKRDQASANRLLGQVAHVTDSRLLPLFTSDQWTAYPQALLTTYGEWYCPTRRGTRGAHPKPRLRPRADLLYAQVIKHRRRGRVIAVQTRVVFGDPAIVTARLAQSSVSQTINTRFVERDNLTQRQQNRRLTRRTNGFSKDITWLEKQLWLSLAYYHLVLPHARLRTPLPAPEPTLGTGSPRRWRPATPAMAAGITDHLWTVRELLSYRVSPLYWQEQPLLEKTVPQLARDSSRKLRGTTEKTKLHLCDSSCCQARQSGCPGILWWTPLSRQKSPKFKLRVHVQQKTCCVLPE